MTWIISLLVLFVWFCQGSISERVLYKELSEVFGVQKGYIFLLFFSCTDFLNLVIKMKKRKAFVISLFIVLLIVAVSSMVLGFIKNPDYLGLSTAILTLCLVITAIYGFQSNREAIRLQTFMEYSFDIYKTISSDEFKKRERNIQKGLSALREQGVVCAIDDIKDDDLKKDIHKYCGYMDGVGILVMEHMINPEVFFIRQASDY